MKHPFPLIFAGAVLLGGVAQAATEAPGLFPSAEYSSPPAAEPTAPVPARTATAANVKPNGSGTVIPNGPVTSDPPGAGASSSATLAEHGETSTSATASH